MKSTFTSLPLAACIALAGLLGSGCNKKESSQTSNRDTGLPTGSAHVTTAEPTSFKEVATHLDPGGSFYLYMGTEQWCKNLSGKMEDFRQIIGRLPNTSQRDRANLNKVFDILTALVKNSGIEDVTALGASGIQVDKGTYLNKFILHHYPGQNKGLLWNAFGTAPHALVGLDYLPANTALASFSDVDVPMLWKAIKEQVEQSGIPELTKGLEMLDTQVQNGLGISLDKLLGSLGGEIGLILTLDSSKMMPIPQPMGAKIEIPQPGLALLLKVKDDTIFNIVDPLLQKMNPQLEKSDKDGVKLRSMAVPGPFPLRPTLARFEKYLCLATSDKLVNELLAVKKGDTKGLKQSDEFKQKSNGIPLEGNSFSYVSPLISRTISQVIESIADSQAAAGRRDGGAELLSKLTGGGKETFTFSVASNTKEGWFTQANSSQHPATAFLGYTMIVPTAIAAAMVMPALAKAKGRAQDIACVNNLKQIGLAARMYSMDHGDVMPKTFEEMKNELNSPRVLICPQSGRNVQNLTWANFNPAEATYEIVSPGVKTDDPTKVYVRCPIHGATCLVDGSVHQGGNAAMSNTQRTR